MLVDARDRFIERMAATMAAASFTDTTAQMQERFGRFDPLDRAKARVLASGPMSKSTGSK